MSVTAIQALLGATRRHLWRQHLGMAVRRGLWGSAAAGLAAAAWHLAQGPAAALAWAGMAAAWWAGWLAWGLARRPTDLDCALWVDRHLGGASALSTWLDLRIPAAAMRAGSPLALGERPNEPGPQAMIDARAAAWLNDWLQARLPAFRQQLAAQPRSLGLTRPLAATLVCAALAGFVLSGAAPATPGPSTPGASSAKAPDAAPPADPDAVAAASAPRLADLAGELSRTLRASPPAAAANRSPGAPNTAAPAGQAAASPSDVAPPTGSAPAAGRGRQAATPAKPDDGRDPAQAAARGTAQAAAGTGRGAGTSVDTDAPAPSARPPLPALTVQGVPVAGRDQPPQRQADMAQTGTYDDLQTLRRAEPAPLPTAAAALAPTAGTETRLSPTEASYVQAWMKAMTRPGR